MKVNASKTKVMAFCVQGSVGMASEVYDTYCRSIKAHKGMMQHTDTSLEEHAQRTTLVLPEAPTHALGCPFHDCPYVARGGQHRPHTTKQQLSKAALLEHLQSRHGSSCETRAAAGPLPPAPSCAWRPKLTRLNPPWMFRDSYVRIAGDQIDFVDSFRHLGTIHRADGKQTDDQWEKVAKARAKYFSISRLWGHSGHSTKVKGALFASVITPVLLAGIAASPALASDEDALHTFYHTSLKRIAGLHDHDILDDEGNVIGRHRFSYEDAVRATGVPTLTALRRRERINLLGVVARAPLDSPYKSQAFIQLLHPEHSDARCLWTARALADLRATDEHSLGLTLADATHKAKWVRKTATMVNNSRLCADSRHAFAPSRRPVEGTEDYGFLLYERADEESDTESGVSWLDHIEAMLA
jgi:hypothetical protein